MKIKFAPKFHQRLNEISDFIVTETKSKELTIKYIVNLKKHINTYLISYPKLGRPAEEFGKNIRKLVHQRYTILYRVEKEYILVITIYKENLPF